MKYIYFGIVSSIKMFVSIPGSGAGSIVKEKKLPRILYSLFPSIYAEKSKWLRYELPKS